MLLICVTISVLLGVPTAHGLNVLHVALAGSFTLTLTPSFHLTRKTVQKEDCAPISSDAMKETIVLDQFQTLCNKITTDLFVLLTRAVCHSTGVGRLESRILCSKFLS